MKILLIAGHGQGDSGAVGCDLVEADETRALLSLVYEKLKDYVTAVRYDTSVDCYQQSKAGTVLHVPPKPVKPVATIFHRERCSMSANY